MNARVQAVLQRSHVKHQHSIKSKSSALFPFFLLEMLYKGQMFLLTVEAEEWQEKGQGG